MISYMTMPIYFEKESRQNEIWDASSDLQLFCERIAPALEITVRFMGEELSDRVTRQYNDTCRELAPLYGISFVEIPRVGINGDVISASSVRKYLKEGKFDLVQVSTPKENWELLRKYLK